MIRQQVLSLALWCLVAPSAMAEEVPLPSDVATISEPQELMLGSQQIYAQGFSTALSLEQLRAFYAQALPKAGWRITPSPMEAQWPAQLQATLQEHPEMADHQDLAQAQSPAFEQRLQQMTAQQLFAVRGQEQLMLQFNPRASDTLVVVNRWQRQADQATPCCDGEAAVPPLLRKLPDSVPRYARGRMISTGAAPTHRPGRQAMSEIYLTDDSVEEVAQHYRTQMAYGGWTLVTIPTMPSPLQMLGHDPRSRQLEANSLSFQNDQGLCGVAIVEWQGKLAEWLPSSVGSLTGAAGQLPTERTLIVVTYIQSPGLMKP